MIKLQKCFIAVIICVMILSPLSIHSTAVEPENSRSVITDLTEIGGASINSLRLMPQQIRSNVIITNPGSPPNFYNMQVLNHMLRELTERTYVLLLYHNYQGPVMQQQIITYLNNSISALQDVTAHFLPAPTFDNPQIQSSWNEWSLGIRAIQGLYFNNRYQALAGLRTFWGSIANLHAHTLQVVHRSPHNRTNEETVANIISSLRFMEGFTNRWNPPRNIIIPADRFDQTDVYAVTRTQFFTTAEIANREEREDRVVRSIEFATREFSTRIQENLAFVTLRDPEELEALYNEMNPDSEFHFLDHLTGPNMWDILPEGRWRESWYEDGTSRVMDEGVALRDLYLAAFAATAAHIPFISRSGDEQFLDVVTHLMGVQHSVEQTHQVRALLGEMLQFSKPLYAVHSARRTEVTGLGVSFIDVSGPARRLTLGRLLSTLESQGTFAAGVIPGHMFREGNAWQYRSAEVIVTPDAASPGESELIVVLMNEEDGDLITINSQIRVVFEVDGSMENIVPDRSAAANLLRTVGRGILNAPQRAFNWFRAPENQVALLEGLGSSILDRPTPGSITFGLLDNIYNSLDMRSELQALLNQPLLLTVFGDIITTEGLVILPAAANPTFFARPLVDNTWAYNPFTAAFFNAYPVIGGSVSSPTISNPRDLQKWVFASGVPYITLPQRRNDPISLIDGRVVSGNTLPHWIIDMRTRPPRGRAGVSFVPIMEGPVRTPNPTEIALLFPYFLMPNLFGDGIGQALTPAAAQVVTGAMYIGGSHLETRRQAHIIRLRSIRSSTGVTVLPHHVAEVHHGPRSVEDRQFAARLIGANMLAYITALDSQYVIYAWGDDSRPSGNGMLRETFMFVNVILPVLDGMVFPRTYYQDATTERLILFRDAGVFSRYFNRIAHAILTTAFRVENFIGISSPSDGSILSPIYRVIHAYWYLVFLLMGVVLLLTFVFTRNFVKTMIAGCSIILVAFLFLYIVPRTLPTILGNVSNAYTRRLVHQSMLIRGENHSATFATETDGFMGSIKLYSTTINEAIAIRRQVGYDTAEFMTGSVWLDDRVGIFLRGTEIRMDLRTLWRENTIATQFVDTWINYTAPRTIRRDLSPYRGQIFSDQLVIVNQLANPSMVNYYMPFLFLQDGLIYTLNTFLHQYRVPRSVIQFLDGNVQDSYIVATFSRSIPFLAILPHVQVTLSQDARFSQDARILREHFPNPGDIFQIQWLVDTPFNELPTYIANTMWGQTMWRTGFYQPEFSYRLRQLLVNYVNDAGYRFFINISAQPGLQSDENLIKLATLEATFAFNRFISEFGNMVYPQHISTSYLSVGDIIAAGLIHQNPFFQVYNIDILPIVYGSRGYAGLFSLMILSISMMLIALINSGIHIIYLLVVILAIVMAITKKTVRPAFVFAAFMFLSLLGLGILSIGAWHVFWILPFRSSLHWLAFMNVLVIVLFVLAVIFTIKRTFRYISNVKEHEENSFENLKNRVMRQ